MYSEQLTNLLVDDGRRYSVSIDDSCTRPRPDDWHNRLVGPVVKASAARATNLISFLLSVWIFFSDSNTVVTLPGTWRYRVSVGTGRSSVNIL